MSNQHTPGPWSSIQRDGSDVVCIDGPDGTPIADLDTVEVGGRPETSANARLIASSPTLLEAAAASIEAINQGEADMALIYLRHAVKQAVEGGAS